MRSRSYDIPLLPRHSQHAKRKAAGSRTWLIVSKSGQASVEELGKQKVMRLIGITAHDLRLVAEPELSYPSAILRRERAVVLNLEHVKAILTAHQVLVPNPRDPRIASFVNDLQLKLSHFRAAMRTDNEMEQPPTDTPPEESKEAPAEDCSRREISKPLPFEFKALEICLESLCKSFDSETWTLEKEAYPALDQLSAKTSTNNLKRVKVIKGRLVALTGRVQKVRNEFEHILDDDIHMAQMYLTDKLANLESDAMVHEDEIDDVDDHDLHEDDIDDVVDDHDLSTGDAIDGNMSSKTSTAAASDLKPNVEELEMLLGAYFVEIEGILNKLSTLQEYVNDTEDYINIVLDNKQNELLRMGIVISTATFMMTLAVVAIGFLSINIRIPLFDFGTYAQWYEAAGGCALCSVFLYIMAILVLKWFKFLG